MVTQLLRPWIDHPDEAGLLTDFDGTLAPIVDDPATATPAPVIPGLLAALADRLALVAVVSGRPVRYLADRLGAAADRLVVVGLYGLERLDRGAVVTHPAAERWRATVAGVVAEARDAAPPGVGVEDKGLTLTLHARARPERTAWIAEFAGEVERRVGLVAHDGRLSVELLPPIEVDKGTVVASLIAELGAACYVGDDLGDLAAFDALAAHRAAGATTLAVAVASDEAPAELLDRADLVVDGPGGVVELFEVLAGS